MVLKNDHAGIPSNHGPILTACRPANKAGNGRRPGLPPSCSWKMGLKEDSKDPRPHGSHSGPLLPCEKHRRLSDPLCPLRPSRSMESIECKPFEAKSPATDMSWFWRCRTNTKSFNESARHASHRGDPRGCPGIGQARGPAPTGIYAKRLCVRPGPEARGAWRVHGCAVDYAPSRTPHEECGDRIRAKEPR